MGQVALRGFRPQVSTCLSGLPLWVAWSRLSVQAGTVLGRQHPQEEGAERCNTCRLPTAHQEPLCSGTPRGARMRLGGRSPQSPPPTTDPDPDHKLRLQGPEQGNSTSRPPL